MNSILSVTISSESYINETKSRWTLKCFSLLLFIQLSQLLLCGGADNCLHMFSTAEALSTTESSTDGNMADWTKYSIWQRHFWSLCERDSISVLKKYAYTKHLKVPWIFHIAIWVIRKHHQTEVLVLLRRSSLVRDQADLISWRPCLWAY